MAVAVAREASADAHLSSLRPHTLVAEGTDISRGAGVAVAVARKALEDAYLDPVEAILNIKSDALYNTKTYNLI